MASPKHKRLTQTSCKYRPFVWYVVIITVWKVICCYGVVIGSAVSDRLLRCGYWQRGKCVICCYGLVIGSAVSGLLLRFGYWQRGK